MVLVFEFLFRLFCMLCVWGCACFLVLWYICMLVTCCLLCFVSCLLCWLLVVGIVRLGVARLVGFVWVGLVVVWVAGVRVCTVVLIAF